MAIGIITLDKAIKKVVSTYKDGTPKARIIDCLNDFQLFSWEDWLQLSPSENEEGMRSVNAIFRIPEVIQYTRYDKLPKTRLNYNRSAVYKRDNHSCQYCGEQKTRSELSLDHVVPRCQGGVTSWENVVVACTKCNSKKAGRTPKEAKMKLLNVPQKPNYNFFYDEVKIKSWEQFLKNCTWNIDQ